MAELTGERVGHPHEWLQASAEITRRLLAGEHGDPMKLLAREARRVAAVDVAAVALPTYDKDWLRVVAAAGARSERLAGRLYETENSVPGTVLTDGEPIAHRLVENADGMDAHVLYVPMVGATGSSGVLILLRDLAEFSEDDVTMASTFASEVALALEVANARADQRRVSMLEDRARIARDLHDHVIQRLFAAGLGLQGLVGKVSPEVADRILTHINELDDTIRQIRTSIFQLQSPPRGSSHSVRSDLLTIVEESTRLLGFEPQARFDGPIDTMIDTALGEELQACLREALSNVARHAKATAVRVLLTVDPRQAVLEVEDNGIGMGARSRSSGLSNLRRRAQRRGGALELADTNPSGTLLIWRVPI